MVKLGSVAEKALALLREHPAGLSMRELREMTGSTESQEHFNRRVREIRKVYELTTQRDLDRGTVYTLGGPAKVAAGDDGQISERLRAAVLHMAGQKCQMCGKTIKEDGIRLQVDHKIPSSWGGKTELENLWAICEACNRGKRNFFGTFDTDEMKAIMGFASVHERIANMLRLHLGSPVPAYILEFVANAVDQQEDWHKRLRELRYPGIDLNITVSKKKINGRMKSFYTLSDWKDLPSNHRQIIREHDRRPRPRVDS